MTKPEPRVGDLAPLDRLPIGSAGTIEKVDGEGKLRRRLFDMGLTPGAEVYLRKLAPLGDPVEITLRGYELSLRKMEASHVLIRISSLEKKEGK